MTEQPDGESDIPTRATPESGPAIPNELIFGCLLAVLAYAVKTRRGPLLFDAPAERRVQHGVSSVSPLSGVLAAISFVVWPRPAMAGSAVVCTVLLRFRRPVNALQVAILTYLANESGYRLSRWVRRPRPSGHGIRVQRRITKTFGFPSGHVVHSTAVLGFVLYLTQQLSDELPTVVVWLLRLFAAPIVTLIGVSRVASGEHWPSDVLGGRLLGLAWLALFIRLSRRGHERRLR